VSPAETCMDTIEQEIAETEQSLENWRNKLALAQQAVADAQAHVENAMRQIDRHDGRLDGLRWAYDSTTEPSE